MSSEWRDLVYPLGFIASFGFTLRFLLQWITSEKEQRSTVTRSFWIISLFSNVIMALHTLFQIQYPICMIQVGNAVIAWRNLNLMQGVEKQISLKKLLLLFPLFFSLTTIIFLLLNVFLFDSPFTWMRMPTFLSQKNATLSPIWHMIGFLGVCLFSCRFWVQWWHSEKKQHSLLGKPFWCLSLIGALLSLTYFIRLQDLVQLIGPAFGLIPYTRNLLLSSKKIPRPRKVREV